MTYELKSPFKSAALTWQMVARKINQLEPQQQSLALGWIQNASFGETDLCGAEIPDPFSTAVLAIIKSQQQDCEVISNELRVAFAALDQQIQSHAVSGSVSSSTATNNEAMTQFNQNIQALNAELRSFLMHLWQRIQSYVPETERTNPEAWIRSIIQNGEAATTALSSSSHTDVKTLDTEIDNWNILLDKFIHLTAYLPNTLLSKKAVAQAPVDPKKSPLTTLCQTIEVAGTALGLLGQLNHDPKLNKIPAIAKSTSSILQGVGMVAIAGATLGGVGLILGGVSGLVKCFQSNGQSKIVKALVKQLKFISGQVQALHQDMRQHFSVVFEALGIIQKDMLEGFFQLAQQQDHILETLEDLAQKQVQFFQSQQRAITNLYQQQQQQGRRLDTNLQELALTSVKEKLANIYFNCESQIASVDTYRDNFFKVLTVARESAKQQAFLGTHHRYAQWEDWARQKNIENSAIFYAFNLGAIQQIARDLLAFEDNKNSSLVNPVLWLNAVTALQNLQQAQSQGLASLPQSQKDVYKSHVQNIIQDGRDTLRFIEALPLNILLDRLRQQHIICSTALLKTVIQHKAEQLKMLQNWFKTQLNQWASALQTNITHLIVPSFSSQITESQHHVAMNERAITNLSSVLQEQVNTAKSEYFEGIKQEWLVTCQTALNTAEQQFSLDAERALINIAPLPLLASPDTADMSLQFPVLLDTANPAIARLILAKFIGLLSQLEVRYRFEQEAQQWCLTIDLVFTQAGDTQRYPLGGFKVPIGFAHTHYGLDERLFYLIGGGSYGSAQQTLSEPSSYAQLNASLRNLSSGNEWRYETLQKAAIDTFQLITTQSLAVPMVLSPTTALMQTLTDIEGATHAWFLQQHLKLEPELATQLVTLGQPLFQNGQIFEAIVDFAQLLLAGQGELFAKCFQQIFSLTLRQLIFSFLRAENPASYSEQLEIINNNWQQYIDVVLPMLQILPDETGWIYALRQGLSILEEILPLYDHSLQQTPATSTPSVISTQLPIVADNFVKGLQNYNTAKYLMRTERESTQSEKIYTYFKTAKTLFKACPEHPQAQKKLEKISEYLTPGAKRG